MSSSPPISSAWGGRLVLGAVTVTGLFLGLNTYFPHVSQRLLQRSSSVNLEQTLAPWAVDWLDWLRAGVPHFDLLVCVLVAVSVLGLFVLAFRRASATRVEAKDNETDVSYCVNKMTMDQFEDMSVTRKSVMDLINSSEYRAMMKERKKARSNSGSPKNRKQEDPETEEDDLLDDLLEDIDSS